MFPVGTVLRYYPAPSANPCPIMDWNHYTAIVVENGVYQLKCDYVGGHKELYKTVESWLRFLSSRVRNVRLTVENLNVTLPVPSNKSNTSNQELTSTTKLKWNVPNRRTQPQNMWPKHIYTIIKECNPAFLQRTDIHAAYQHLMEGLLLYAPRIMRTYEPHMDNKYNRGIHIQVIEELIAESISTHNAVSRQEFQVAALDIMARYSVLYDLIKHEVVPYMERKSREIKVEKEKKNHSHDLQRCINAHTRLSQQHAIAQAELELKFKEKERYLQRLISEHQAKLDALS
jgi:hypothetical protein